MIKKLNYLFSFTALISGVIAPAMVLVTPSLSHSSQTKLNDDTANTDVSFVVPSTQLEGWGITQGDLRFSVLSEASVGVVGTVCLKEVNGIKDIFIGENLNILPYVCNEGLTYRVTEIGDFAFADLPSDNITGKVTLNEGLEKIGEGAFGRYNCHKQDIYIPRTVKSIGALAFNDANVKNFFLASDDITFGFDPFGYDTHIVHVNQSAYDYYHQQEFLKYYVIYAYEETSDLDLEFTKDGWEGNLQLSRDQTFYNDVIAIKAGLNCNPILTTTLISGPEDYYPGTWVFCHQSADNAHIDFEINPFLMPYFPNSWLFIVKVTSSANPNCYINIPVTIYCEITPNSSAPTLIYNSLLVDNTIIYDGETYFLKLKSSDYILHINALSFTIGWMYPFQNTEADWVGSEQLSGYCFADEHECSWIHISKNLPKGLYTTRIILDEPGTLATEQFVFQILIEHEKGFVGSGLMYGIIFGGAAIVAGGICCIVFRKRIKNLFLKIKNRFHKGK